MTLVIIGIKFFQLYCKVCEDYKTFSDEWKLCYSCGWICHQHTELYNCHTCLCTWCKDRCRTHNCSNF